jgi:hypothetical protein
VGARSALYDKCVNDAAPLVNWSIRLSVNEVVARDDLVYTLRREIDDRALTKSDIVRTLIALASNPVVRAELVRSFVNYRDGHHDDRSDCASRREPSNVLGLSYER